MKRSSRSVTGVLAIATVLLAACGQEAAEAAPEAAAVTVTEIDGSDLHRVTLSEGAAERLGIETAAVTEDGIPYSALLYDASGATWTYTNPEALVFVRQQVEVELIEGDIARLTSGPGTDTLVVTVGAAELWGAETGVGGGH